MLIQIKNPDALHLGKPIVWRVGIGVLYEYDGIVIQRAEEWCKIFFNDGTTETLWYNDLTTTHEFAIYAMEIKC